MMQCEILMWTLDESMSEHSIVSVRDYLIGATFGTEKQTAISFGSLIGVIVTDDLGEEFLLKPIMSVVEQKLA